MNHFRHSACPLCKSSHIQKSGDILYPTKVKFSTLDVELANTPELWSCLACQSWFVQNIVSQQIAFDLYQTGDSDWRWSSRPFKDDKTKKMITALSDIVASKKSCLDIGCGSGSWLDHCKERGLKTAGVDLSTSSLNSIRKNGHKAYSSELDVDRQYDIVSAFDLIEHLYNPSEWFEKCLSLVNPNGYLIIFTGNAQSLSAKLTKNNWWYLKYPEHILFPSLKFYKNLKSWKLVGKFKDYASIGYQATLRQKGISILSGLIRNRQYTGLPALGPDHMLLVFQKEES